MTNSWPNLAAENLLSEGSLIVAILHRGFGRDALYLAEGEGARGVTFLHGTGNHLYKLAQPFTAETDNRKEVVFVVCPVDIAGKIMLAWQRLLGLQTAAKGVFFELPVHHGVGLVSRSQKLNEPLKQTPDEEMKDAEKGKEAFDEHRG